MLIVYKRCNIIILLKIWSYSGPIYNYFASVKYKLYSSQPRLVHPYKQARTILLNAVFGCKKYRNCKNECYLVNIMCIVPFNQTAPRCTYIILQYYLSERRQNENIHHLYKPSQMPSITRSCLLYKTAAHQHLFVTISMTRVRVIDKKYMETIIIGT